MKYYKNYKGGQDDQTGGEVNIHEHLSCLSFTQSILNSQPGSLKNKILFYEKVTDCNEICEARGVVGFCFGSSYLGLLRGSLAG